MTASGPDPIDAEVGARLRDRRCRLNVTQAQLANSLGVSFQQIQKYENGRSRISASKLVRAAAALETSVGGLVGEDGAELIEAIATAGWTTPGAQELLRAFAKIKDSKDRAAVIRIARDMSVAHRAAEPTRAAS